MSTTDTRSQRSTLASVTSTAFETNGWDVLAVARTTEPETSEEPSGIVAFLYTAPHADACCGTAYWRSYDGQVVFDWGHYDLSYAAALADFTARVGKGR